MADPASSPDPLRPLQTALGILTVLLGGLMIALLAPLLFGSSIADIGSSSVCVSTRSASVGYVPPPTMTTLVVSTTEAIATGALVGQMVPGTFDLGLVMEHWNVSVALLITSAGLITVSRVLNRAVALREEVDATI